MADKKVILVIDDEPLVVDMITTFLGFKGYEVRGAYNGEDGLTLIPLEKPDVLLLDLMLPDIEGFEICTRVRAMPDFAHLPVLIISARSDPESKKRAERAGANGYLTKPLRMPDLVAELEKLLSAPPAPAPAPVIAPVVQEVPVQPAPATVIASVVQEVPVQPTLTPIPGPEKPAETPPAPTALIAPAIEEAPVQPATLTPPPEPEKPAGTLPAPQVAPGNEKPAEIPPAPQA